MNAEIIAVGTELLLGDILNRNAQYLSKELALLGIGVYYQTVVGDNEERLTAVFNNAYNRGADIIITTGGLGPTKDDITKEIAAKYFGLELEFNQEAMNDIAAFFVKQRISIKEANKKQAFFPKDSLILKNPNGTAPGCIIEKDNKIMILMPGPARENQPMFENEVLPYLLKKQDSVIVSKTLRMSGIGESMAADELNDLLLTENPTVAPYAKSTEVHFRITAKGKTAEEAKNLIEPITGEIYKRMSKNVYGEDEQTLAEVVIEQLKQKNLKIAVCESCTGGLLSSAFVDVPGASGVFLEGAITYSNQAKISRLGVTEEAINIDGAVSDRCAAEMAVGVANSSNADVGISITGIAGPDGGTEEKPVGLVYIGLYLNGGIKVVEHRFMGSRERIRTRAVASALNLLWRELLKV